MIDLKDPKIRERIGVFLLVVILVLSGVILMRDKSEPTSFKANVSQNQANSSSSTGEKSANLSSSQQASNGNIKAKININTASIEDLDTLPGIGAVTAAKIIDFRTKNGGFKTIEGIKDVNGIGEVKYAKLKDLISI